VLNFIRIKTVLYLYIAPVVLFTLQQHCNTLLVGFWATVCKMVHPMLSDCCLSCVSVCPVLSVTFVHCGQTVGRLKIKLGMQVGLGPGHTVLDGDSAIMHLSHLH